MTHWCIIPARAGSTRIRLKNFRPFHGYPIVARTAMRALGVKLFDHIVISCDDPELLPPATDIAVTAHLRRREDAGDDVGTLEVTRRIAADLGVKPHHFVCCIYPCAGPFIEPEDLLLGESLINGAPSNTAHVFAVGADPLRDAGQWYWSTGYALDERTPLIGTATRMVRIPSERVCDINTPEDWERAERMYLELYGGESGGDSTRASVGD